MRGEVAIVFAPESNVFNYLQQGRTDWYAECARGAYQGFFDLNVQPDFVHVDDLPSLASADGATNPYRLLYLPFPVHLRSESAAALRAWVERGGTLVSEGCPGYFGERGRAGTAQPNLGLDALFGAREHHVEFTPDVTDDVTFSLDGVHTPIPGALYLQAYEPAGGRVTGAYAAGYGAAGGLPAVIEHAFGQGRTLLIGTFPGAARHRALDPVTRHGAPTGSTFTTHRLAHVSGLPSEERLAALQAFFARLLEWAGITPHVRTDNPAVIARLHQDPEPGARVLWVLNPSRTAQHAALTLAPDAPPCAGASLYWPPEGASVSIQERSLALEIGPRDAAVVRLLPSENRRP